MTLICLCIVCTCYLVSSYLLSQFELAAQFGADVPDLSLRLLFLQLGLTQTKPQLCTHLTKAHMELNAVFAVHEEKK